MAEQKTDWCWCYENPNAAAELIDELDAALAAKDARIAELEGDAARYRWLRDTCERRWCIMYRDIEIVISESGADSCDDLDAVIDAAMNGATDND